MENPNQNDAKDVTPPTPSNSATKNSSGALAPTVPSDSNNESKQEDYKAIMAQFTQSFASELQGKINRLDLIVGESHWLSVGTYKETIIRELLRDYVPAKFKIGTGFVLAEHPTEHVRLLSRQIDILIWDTTFPPIFALGDFAIVTPEACRVAIEVKGHLDHSQLREALENLETLSWFVYSANRGGGWFQSYLFAGEIGEEIKFPDSIFNSLHKTYLQVPYVVQSNGSVKEWSMTIDRRLAWSVANAHLGSMPWVNAVSVLGHGIIELQNFMISKQKWMPGYFVSEKGDGFGRLMALILHSLRFERRAESRYGIIPRPSTTKEKAVLLFPFSEEIEKHVNEGPSGFSAFRPRKPWVWTPDDAKAKSERLKKKSSEITKAEMLEVEGEG